MREIQVVVVSSVVELGQGMGIMVSAIQLRAGARL